MKLGVQIIVKENDFRQKMGKVIFPLLVEDVLSKICFGNQTAEIKTLNKSLMTYNNIPSVIPLVGSVEGDVHSLTSTL